MDAMQEAGINAMKYPARSAGAKNHNCDNDMADTAEGLGLSAVAAVCPGCPYRKECLVSGYLAELAAMKLADVAVATHARTVFTGFPKLCEGRGEFVSVHEDVANTVCPDAIVSIDDLQKAADIVNRVLTDPTWLDWLGQATSRDDDGNSVPNDRLAERRNKLDYFVRRLAELADSLVAQLQSAERTKAVTILTPIAKATGIESLLLRACLESKAKFRASPWRLLLAILTGDLFSVGVICDDRDNAKTD